MYDNCNECPYNGKKSCHLRHRSQEIRQNICHLVSLPIKPVHDDRWLQNQVDSILKKWANLGITKMPSEYFPHLQETEYSFEDFHHIAFATGTPEQQARHFQDVLVSTAAICDFRKQDITRCKFFVNSKGEAHAEMPK